MRRDSQAFLVDIIEASDAILDAVRGISFRNKITHDEYTKVDHTLVWGVIRTYLQPLRADCALLLERRNATDD